MRLHEANELLSLDAKISLAFDLLTKAIVQIEELEHYPHIAEVLRRSRHLAAQTQTLLEPHIHTAGKVVDREACHVVVS